MSHQRAAFALASLLLALPACNKDKASEPVTPPSATDQAATEPTESQPEPPAEPAAPSKLETADFSVPIPAGYQILGANKLAAIAGKTGQSIDGVLTKPKAAADHFATSIVFTVIPATDVNPQTACAEVSTEMAKATGTKAQPPKDVEFPFGKTCQFEMGDDTQKAIQTIAFVEKKFWTVTCNFDPRDEASPKECNEVLTGFAAK